MVRGPLRECANPGATLNAAVSSGATPVPIPALENLDAPTGLGVGPRVHTRTVEVSALPQRLSQSRLADSSLQAWASTHC